MKLLVVFLVALASYVNADCNILEALKVKHQWEGAFSEGENRINFVIAVWRDFFDEHEELIPLFKRVRGENIYSPKFIAHGTRVLSGLDQVISVLDDAEVLEQYLIHLKSQHTERGTKPEYFDLFGKYLFNQLGHKLQDNFDQDAWTDCYAVIAGGIKP